MPGPETGANPEPGSGGSPGRVRPRQNVVSRSRSGFRRRHETVGYWTLLAVVLTLVIWFLVSSAINSSDARDAEATVIATLFVPETATAAAEQQAEAAQ